MVTTVMANPWFYIGLRRAVREAQLQGIDSRDSSSRCVHRDNGEAEEQTLIISPSRQDARIGIDYSQRYKTLAAEDDP